MAALLQSAFLGAARLRIADAAAPRRAAPQPFVSNGSVTTMKSRQTYQVEVVVAAEDSQDVALKRFRREVQQLGLVQEVRRRRYFENSVDEKKRRLRESRLKAKKARQGRAPPTRTFGQAGPQGAAEPAPFSDLFGTPEDIFAEVLGSGSLAGSMGSMGSMSLDSMDFDGGRRR